MASSSGSTLDALEVLHAEHSYLSSLFAELGRERDPGRARGLFRTLYEELRAFMAAEKVVLYAALALEPGARGVLRRALAAHDHIFALADELLATSPGLPPWRETARDLERALAEHGAAEERELFPMRVGGENLQGLGGRLQDAAAHWRAAECGGLHAPPVRPGAGHGR